MEEIRDVNQRLIDTVVDISDEEVDPTAAAAAAEGAEGTIVKCSFIAVALSPSLKSQYASAQMVGFYDSKTICTLFIVSFLQHNFVLICVLLPCSHQFNPCACLFLQIILIAPPYS